MKDSVVQEATAAAREAAAREIAMTWQQHAQAEQALQAAQRLSQP